jgi:hypothetical protein
MLMNCAEAIVRHALKGLRPAVVLATVFVMALPLLAAAPTITSATISTDQTKITISGQNFSISGTKPIVVLGGKTLTLQPGFTSTTIVANMPSNPSLPPGDYSLTVNSSASFTVTVAGRTRL